MKNLIKKVNYSEWRTFQPFLAGGPCCNFAFPQGDCFAFYPDNGNRGIAAMVWYTYAFRQSPYRKDAIPAIRGLCRHDEINFLNQNVRLLARISTLPAFRCHGYAGKLLAATLLKLKIPFVECLTAHDDVRRLLLKAGFVCKNNGGGSNIDYWLWMAAAE